jgi:hypothetical protein
MGSLEGRRISELRRSGASGKHLNKGRRQMEKQVESEARDEMDLPWSEDADDAEG